MGLCISAPATFDDAVCAGHASIFHRRTDFRKTERSWLQLRPISENLTVGVPHIPESLDKTSVIATQRSLLKTLCAESNIGNPVLWFYTPMAVSFADDIRAAVVVYDCMDEFAAFKDAPPELAELEHTLLERADLVFTGGFSLYEAKRNRHPSVHAFPSAVDVAHFAAARGGLPDPVDQAGIPHPRLGFFGVIDERMDTALLTSVARRRPDWHFIMIGPVAKSIRRSCHTLTTFITSAASTTRTCQTMPRTGMRRLCRSR